MSTDFAAITSGKATARSTGDGKSETSSCDMKRAQLTDNFRGIRAPCHNFPPTGESRNTIKLDYRKNIASHRKILPDSWNIDKLSKTVYGPLNQFWHYTSRVVGKHQRLLPSSTSEFQSPRSLCRAHTGREATVWFQKANS